jgi:putative intracellular protease/amidase
VRGDTVTLIIHFSLLTTHHSLLEDWKKFRNMNKKQITISLIMVLIMLPMAIFAQPKQPRNVAIMLWNGVELLDFAGPGEVFAASGFNTYTVSVDGKEILSQRFVTVVPKYSFETAPVPDIVVFPGGGATAISNNEKVLEWVRNRVAQGGFIMSVCTGAYVVANTGLVKGKNITTHWGSIENLGKLHPELTVLEKTRLVDNGQIITTAGVSAGMDGALHLVSRILGKDVALETAHYMEYEKWNPAEARIDFKNQYIEQLKSALMSNDKKVTSPDLKHPVTLPYEGEFRNLAFEFLDKGMQREAATALETCIKVYPGSSRSSFKLGELNRQLGKPTPISEEAFLKLISNGKVDEAFTVFEKEQKAFPGWVIFREDPMVTLGIEADSRKDYQSSLKIFKMLASSYPGFRSCYNLGETYLNMGNKKESLSYYQKALSYNPGDDEVTKIIANLQRDIHN